MSLRMSIHISAYWFDQVKEKGKRIKLHEEGRRMEAAKILKKIKLKSRKKINSEGRICMQIIAISHT